MVFTDGKRKNEEIYTMITKTKNKQENWSVGDMVNVTIKEWNGSKYYFTKAKMKLKEFMDYDNRPESLIPNQEKSYSITQKKFVPNRYIWRVEWIVNNHSFF